MEKVSLINIFKAFFHIGLILLGGGYVIVPVMKELLVEKRQWISEDELIDFYCVAQCLPGIIAINVSILTANKLMKFKGALVAILALSLSPFLSIILIAKFLNLIMNIAFIESVFWGVNISVIILIYLNIKEMWQKSMQDIFCYIWFFIILLLSFLKINPAFLIIISVFAGFVVYKIRKFKNE